MAQSPVISYHEVRIRIFDEDYPWTRPGARGTSICSAIDRVGLYLYPGLRLGYDEAEGDELTPVFTYRGWRIQVLDAEGRQVTQSDTLYHTAWLVATRVRPEEAISARDLYEAIGIQHHRHFGTGGDPKRHPVSKANTLEAAILQLIVFVHETP